MKNQFTLFLLSVLFLFIFSKSSGQSFPYSLITETGTYSDLEEATVLTSPNDFWDDPQYLNIPLGFEFEFFGNTYTTITLDDYFYGGMLSFKDLDLPGSTSPVIIAYIDDLMDVETVAPNMQSSISHLTDGSSGNMIFKMEWNNCGFFNEIEDSSSIQNIINLQLWIYEATGNIEVRFGPNMLPEGDVIHDFGSPMIGLVEEFKGDDETFNRAWIGTGEIDNPSIDTVFSVDELDEAQGFTSEPEDGRVYRFENLSTNVFAPTNQLEIKIYPSLVVDEFYVEMDQEILQKNTQLVILNNLGQKVFSKKITAAKERLDASNFPKGIYYVSIANEDGMGTQKIVKQ